MAGVLVRRLGDSRVLGKENGLEYELAVQEVEKTNWSKNQVRRIIVFGLSYRRRGLNCFFSWRSTGWHCRIL